MTLQELWDKVNQLKDQYPPETLVVRETNDFGFEYVYDVRFIDSQKAQESIELSNIPDVKEYLRLNQAKTEGVIAIGYYSEPYDRNDWCRYCGKPFMDSQLIYGLDPYDKEIKRQENYTVLCRECYRHLCNEI